MSKFSKSPIFFTEIGFKAVFSDPEIIPSFLGSMASFTSPLSEGFSKLGDSGDKSVTEYSGTCLSDFDLYIVSLSANSTAVCKSFMLEVF